MTGTKRRCCGASAGGDPGGVIVTVKLSLATLPASSPAVQVMVVVPIAKVLPLDGVQLTGIVPATASLAVAVNVTTAPADVSASTVTSSGKTSVGGVVAMVKVSDTSSSNVIPPTLLNVAQAISIYWSSGSG